MKQLLNEEKTTGDRKKSGYRWRREAINVEVCGGAKITKIIVASKEGNSGNDNILKPRKAIHFFPF